jgi:hypothetical protein
MKHLTGHESLEDILKLAADGEQMLLSASAMEIILRSVATKKLTAESAQRLADALECEFVDYEDFKAETIAQALFELSSPEINGGVTQSRCMELVANLVVPDSPLP